MVNVQNRRLIKLYQTEHQSEYGPGVGAASFSPKTDRVIFIQGIRNSDEEKPYGFTRRTGIAIDVDKPEISIFMDAKDILAPFTAGALRGGTHAHAWNGAGEWISFTYNDYVIEQLSKTDTTIHDLRTVGVMFPKQVTVYNDAGLENNSGQMFSVIISDVKENPYPGSDEIDKAFDEGWIGTKGYRQLNGDWQPRAIAFQGNIRDKNGNSKTEIFVVDLPDDLTQNIPGQPLEGTSVLRPGIPAGVKQRRLTFLKNGVQGPRHWLRSTPDGDLIAFLTKDDFGFINVFGVSPNGDIVKQLTFNKFDIQSGINFSPDGKYLAYVAEKSVYITEIVTGQSTKLTENATSSTKPVSCINWSPDGKEVAYNRYVKNGEGDFLQIFLLKIKR